MAEQIIHVRTVDDVRREFRLRGLSISDWARRKGVSVALTHQILKGRRVALRGQSHRIAVLLGLKPGEPGNVESIAFSYAGFVATEFDEGKRNSASVASDCHPDQEAGRSSEEASAANQKAGHAIEQNQ